jgi:acetyl esterase/lipase
VISAASSNVWRAGGQNGVRRTESDALTMKRKLIKAAAFPLLLLGNVAGAQQLNDDIPYVENGHARQVLDVYTPQSAADKGLPIVFWIHGGGWQVGDKGDVALKPKVLTEQGFVFVSTNYRLVPEVEMDVLIRDIAKSLGWVVRNIAKYGGDPQRIFVGGHSAGAQLAALVCIDDRYLKEAGVPFEVLKGCVPVDGDTYDIPKIIMTAEHRQALYGGKMFTFGHRQKFGNNPEKHVDFSAVTHVAKDKGIPPFLILYFSGNPDTTAQARRLEAVLRQADIPVTAYGKEDSNHSRLNNDLGKTDDPATQEFYKFLNAHSG